MLTIEYLLAEIGFDTAEDEPSKSWQALTKCSLRRVFTSPRKCIVRCENTSCYKKIMFSLRTCILKKGNLLHYENACFADPEKMRKQRSSSVPLGKETRRRTSYRRTFDCVIGHHTTCFPSESYQIESNSFWARTTRQKKAIRVRINTAVSSWSRHAFLSFWRTFGHCVRKAMNFYGCSKNVILRRQIISSTCSSLRMRNGLQVGYEWPFSAKQHHLR